jgi:hypothetical protein
MDSSGDGMEGRQVVCIGSSMPIREKRAVPKTAPNRVGSPASSTGGTADLHSGFPLPGSDHGLGRLSDGQAGGFPQTK